MKQTLFSTDPQYKPYSFKSLNGRFIHLSAATKAARRTFILVYGQHATLERIRPIAEALRVYGDVYAVDNPGFGGMDPSYKIKEYPSLPFYASHLKHFLEEYVPEERKVTLLGISYGFQMVTEMLAQYPELHERVEEVMSFVGFVHPKDFRMPLSYSVPLLYFMANSGRTWLGSKVLELAFREPIIVGTYHVTKPIQVKFKSLPKEEAKSYAREQAWLWRINDPRTHAATAWDFFRKNDLTPYRIQVPAIHVGVPNDHLFDNARVAEELKAMYENLAVYEMNLANHAPLDIDSPEKVSDLLPETLRRHIGESINREAVMS